MRPYNAAEPLIFIHVPKSAGLSVRDVVQQWFGAHLHLNYFSKAARSLPERLPDEQLKSQPQAPVIYGHFNKNRGFGVDDLYPDATQFVTILRDPFETAVSLYHYVRSQGPAHYLFEDCQKPLDAFLQDSAPHMLDHFPNGLTLENFRTVLDQRFVEIGIMEDLTTSLTRIAQALDKPFDPATLPHLNRVARDQVPDPALREMFADRFVLEHRIYEFAKDRLRGGH